MARLHRHKTTKNTLREYIETRKMLKNNEEILHLKIATVDGPPESHHLDNKVKKPTCRDD